MATIMKTKVLISCMLYVILSTNLLVNRSHAAENDYDVYRLPDTSEPVSYDLRIKPVVDSVNENYTFFGRVEIVIRAKRYTTKVVLNSRDLIVTSVSGFEDWKTKRLTPINGYVYDEPNERLIIELQKTLVPRRLYNFTVEFNGNLRNDVTGFHKYLYDSRNKSRWIALTHFKPIYARRAFPCYDEPKFKTTYTISVARKSNHFALSNMPLNRSEIESDREGWVWDHFEPTKPIPTYLVAFMVSDFDKNTMNNDNIAMYTRKEFIEDTTYMMGKAPNLLQEVEKFTKIPYMLPKLDMVGIPLLEAYSMGNWGLNSYKEYYLTLSNNSRMDDEILGTMTVLHEILHQWFGNMVTTPQWDYAWLNEGISKYLNYFILDMIEPEWDLNNKFIEDVHQHALAWDEFDDTHPLTFSVLTPNEIINVYDPITVDKSAALFRMLKNMVGEANFKKSLNKFLNDFAYAEAGPKELWEAFDNVLYDDDYVIGNEIILINKSMYLWTEQAGYPLINVELNNDSIVVTQERFTLSDPREPDDTKWLVSLSYTTESNGNFDDVTSKVWLKPTDENAVIPIPADSGWMIFNLQSTGFYRVNYDEKNWKLLLIQLITKPDRIHVLNRAQIVDDAHHLSRAGLVPYNYYISLLEYLMMEDHVTPWSSATNGLTSIMDGIRRYPEEHFKFKEYTKNIADILYTKLSQGQFKNQQTKAGWSKLLTWSCKSGSLACEQSALSHFNAWMNGDDIPSEIEEAAFCTGMKYGNLTVWSKMFELYKTTGSLSDEQIVACLACVENAKTVFKYINLMLLNGNVSAQKLKTIFSSLTTTSYGVNALANYMLIELDEILALEDGHLFASFAYSTLASKVATDDEIDIMNKIRRTVESIDLRAIFNDKHRKIESNLKWMERDHKKIIQAVGKI